MWAGEIVHGVAERVLRDLKRGVTLPRDDEVVSSALAQMRQDFKSSREQRYWQRPKSLALFEHEYDQPITDDEWKQNAEHVAECIRNFFSSDVYERLRRMSSDDFLEIENLSTFSIGGIKVWVKLDCCLKAGTGVFVIDWKTGRSDRGEHAGQLASYALYAARRWGVEPRQIQTLVYNLALAEGQTYTITQETVQQARDEITASAAAMQEYLVDPVTNEARPEDDFPFCEDDRPCRRCNYRQVCPRFADE
jgi:CRISPR/Cas system-associated exonuclease Cas4 (RecB family)